MADLDPKLRSLMQEVAQEMTDYFKQNEEKYSENQKKFDSIHQRLFNHLERKCEKEVEWLKNNANSNRNEVEMRIKDFENCSNKNDFGYGEFVRELQEEQNNYYRIEEECVTGCAKNFSNNQEIKDCLKKCLISSTDKYNSLYSRVEAKMNEINSKI
jgi:exonuclease VII large subunit